MISLAILAGLGGAMLGLRFRVLVLLPVAAAALVVVMGGGLAAGLELPQVALACVVAGVALQLGFLAGAGLRVLDRRQIRRPAPAVRDDRVAHRPMKHARNPSSHQR